MDMKRVIAPIATLVGLAAYGAEGPSTRPAFPSIPELRASANASLSFMAKMSTAAEMGVGFEVAFEPGRERCVVFDVADGTPLFISNGDQVLIYDLFDNRIVLLPHARGFVHFIWDVQRKKPIMMTFGVQTATKNLRNESNDTSLMLRNPEVMPDAPIEVFAGPDGSTIWSVQVELDYFALFQAFTRDPTRFNFCSSEQRDRPGDRERLELSLIGKPIPEEHLRFPDVEALRKSVEIIELDTASALKLVLFLGKNRAWFLKFGLAVGQAERDSMGLVFPDVNWEELAQHDRILGTAYRAALAEQGFSFVARPLATEQSKSKQTTDQRK